MLRPQDEELPEGYFKAKSYKEFVLDRVDEMNLQDIEKSLQSGKITVSNKKDSLNYLHKLLKRLQEIKKMEREYEGENNENVNEYIARTTQLILQIETLK